MLLAAAKVATLALELLHGQGGELGGGVVLGLVLVDLVDGDGRMDHGGLDGLLLHDRLNDLVHMVVDVLTGYGRVGGRSVLHLRDAPGVLELGCLGLQALLDVVWVAVLVGAVLNGSDAVGVLLWEHLAVLDNLNRGVVVVLVHLTVDRRLHVFPLGPDHLLMLHGRLDDLGLGSALVQIYGGSISPRGRWYHASHLWRGSWQAIPLPYSCWRRVGYLEGGSLVWDWVCVELDRFQWATVKQGNADKAAPREVI